jgi:hypothetical protein
LEKGRKRYIKLLRIVRKVSFFRGSSYHRVAFRRSTEPVRERRKLNIACYLKYLGN